MVNKGIIRVSSLTTTIPETAKKTLCQGPFSVKGCRPHRQASVGFLFVACVLASLAILGACSVLFFFACGRGRVAQDGPWQGLARGGGPPSLQIICYCVERVQVEVTHAGGILARVSASLYHSLAIRFCGPHARGSSQAVGQDQDPRHQIPRCCAKSSRGGS